VSLSSDPNATKAALDFRSVKLVPSGNKGSLALREKISRLYGDGIRTEHIITAIATTGSNLTTFLSLLEPGDHVVIQYPTYPQLASLPKGIGCEVSLWKLEPDRGWRFDIDLLTSLITPKTRMIILNNPSNP
jgi:aspartate/methionine/tyrosine aminotransferase